MITEKNLLATLVCASCVATLFLAIPVSSSGTYDPWLDYNGDGIVDLKDVYPMHQAFGTSGDPTKNVNVTNWPTEQPSPSYKVVDSAPWISSWNVSWTNYGFSGWTAWSFDVGGYSKAFIYVKLTNLSYTGPGKTTIYFGAIAHIINGPPYYASSWDFPGANVCNITVYSWYYGGGYFSECIEIEPRGNWLQPGIGLVSTIPEGVATLNVYMYLRNE